jgi:hypothetical protein
MVYINPSHPLRGRIRSLHFAILFLSILALLLSSATASGCKVIKSVYGQRRIAVSAPLCQQVINCAFFDLASADVFGGAIAWRLGSTGENLISHCGSMSCGLTGTVRGAIAIDWPDVFIDECCGQGCYAWYGLFIYQTSRAETKATIGTPSVWDCCPLSAPPGFQGLSSSGPGS